MTDIRNLLELPKEVLTKILRHHFENVRVGISYPSRFDNRTTTFSSVMLSCKTLGRIARQSFVDNAEAHLADLDVLFTEELEDEPEAECAFVCNLTTGTLPRLTPHPIEQFRHVSANTFTIQSVLKRRETCNTHFPHLKHLSLTANLEYHNGEHDSDCVEEIFDVTRRCAAQNIKLHACVCILHLHNLGAHDQSSPSVIGKFKFFLDEHKVVRPFRATLMCPRFYADVEDLIEGNFQVPMGTMDRFSEVWERSSQGHCLAKGDSLGVVVNCDHEDGLVWRDELYEMS